LYSAGAFLIRSIIVERGTSSFLLLSVICKRGTRAPCIQPARSLFDRLLWKEERVRSSCGSESAKEERIASVSSRRVPYSTDCFGKRNKLVPPAIRNLQKRNAQPLYPSDVFLIRSIVLERGMISFLLRSGICKRGTHALRFRFPCRLLQIYGRITAAWHI
jgi:hypothetical protein